MLIGITGPLLAGKSTVARYLKQRHGFLYISLEKSVSDDDDDDDGGMIDYRFEDVEEAMQFVMENWRRDICIEPICHWHEYKAMERRPFFLLISLDAPLTVRHRRFESGNLSRDALSFENFVHLNDRCLYGALLQEDLGTLSLGKYAHHASNDWNVHRIMAAASVHLLNAANSVNEFFIHLEKMNLTCWDRLRPGWDTYFMKLCDLTARRSNCMKRRVGCILVKNNRIIATGYNGTPRGVINCNQGGCQRCNGNARCGEGLDTCICLHAEENALLEAGRERIGVDTTLYCSTCPCLGCAKKIVQMGIREVVYLQAYGMDKATKILFIQAGVRMRQHKLLEDVDLVSDGFSEKLNEPMVAINQLNIGDDLLESLLHASVKV